MVFPGVGSHGLSITFHLTHFRSVRGLVACRNCCQSPQWGRYRLVRFQPKKHGSRLTAPNDRRAMREGLRMGGFLPLLFTRNGCSLLLSMNAATSRSRSGYGSTSLQPVFGINLKPAPHSSSTFFHCSMSDIFGALNARPIQSSAPPH